MASEELGLRQSALLLHAMELPDRVLVLERIDANIRLQLLELIAELDRLGFLPQANLLADLTISKATVTQDNNKNKFPLEMDGQVAYLQSGDSHVIADLLVHESSLLIAQIFLFKNWDWINVVLSRLHPLKRQEVISLIGKTKPFGSREMGILVGTLAKKYEQLVLEAESDNYLTPSTKFINLVKRYFRELKVFIKKDKYEQ